MKALPTEIVYVNGGELYKKPNPVDLGMNYTPSAQADAIFPFVKNDGKQYFITEAFRQHYGNEGGVALDGIDLCPDVSLWLCLGAVSRDERSNYDVFFDVESTAQLRKVAAYYGLPYPIDEVVGDLIDGSRDTINFLNASGHTIVPGCVKWIDGKPAILKLYTYPKRFGSWDVWMYGASYYDHGKLWEQGAVFQKQTGGADIEGAQMRGAMSFRKAELILSKREDGVTTSYQYTRGAEDRDPAMFWKGVESTGRIKRYESAQAVRRALYRMTSGMKMDGRDACPAVSLWLGRSFYDDLGTEELLFCIQSREMLDQVAEYYGLPIPYSEEQRQVLDTNIQLYRARHYDLLGLGEGKHVPVVVGGIVFENGVPTKLLMYTFMRQWEFADEIELPGIAGLLSE